MKCKLQGHWKKSIWIIKQENQKISFLIDGRDKLSDIEQLKGV